MTTTLAARNEFGLKATPRGMAGVCALACVAMATVGLATVAEAEQAYPNRNIRMLVGFPPGGGIDVVARLFAHKMSEILQQTVVVENRPGASGSIAASQVANAAADGYVILGGSNSIIVNRVVNFKSSLDVEKDLFAVGLIARQPMIAITGPDSKITSLRELISIARTSPINFGTPGAYSIPHLLFERFVLSQPGIKMVHVPFSGAANVVTATIAGQIEAAMVTLPAALQLVKSKQLRGLAVTSTTRWRELPNVPTMGEAGFPDIVGSIWGAIFVPAKTPNAVVARIHDAIHKIAAMPNADEELAKLGFELPNVTGKEFRSELSDEIRMWTEVVEKTKPVPR
jgi:tripartite-type tricarboxylate transporter receptor subunit TctC